MTTFVKIVGASVRISVSRGMIVAEGLWEGQLVCFAIDTGAAGELRLAPRDAAGGAECVREERQLIIRALGDKTQALLLQNTGRLVLGSMRARECLATVDTHLPHSLVTLTLLEQLFPSGLHFDLRDRMIRSSSRDVLPRTSVDLQARRRDGVWEVPIVADAKKYWVVFDTGCAESLVIPVDAEGLQPGRRATNVTLADFTFATEVVYRNGSGVGLVGVPFMKRAAWYMDAHGIVLIR